MNPLTNWKESLVFAEFLFESGRIAVRVLSSRIKKQNLVKPSWLQNREK